uniref:beta strand repeat-containing protein n=1 Tax=Erythrobacter alti TaxID=1896145 RepID=UPI0030F3734D
MGNFSGTNAGETIDGTNDADTIEGLGGADTLNGLDGDDVIASDANGSTNQDDGTEVDTLNGGNGDDVLIIGFGDNADGGADFDTIDFNWRGAVAGVTADFTTLFSTGTDTIAGGVIANVEAVRSIIGSDFGDDIDITVLSTPTDFIGGNGDDIFRSSADYANILGGAGNDTLIGGYGFYAGGEGDDTIEGGGSLYGDAGNDIITVTANVGSNSSNTIDGGTGDDTITGGATLGNGSTAEILIGGEGSDTIFGRNGRDLITGGTVAFWHFDTDVDTIDGGAGNDSIYASIGDNIDGGDEEAGTNGDNLYISYLGAASGLILDFSLLAGGGTAVVQGGTITDIEFITVRGTDFDDEITVFGNGAIEGNDGDDLLVGGVGNNDLKGGAGADIMQGMDGNDRLFSGDENGSGSSVDTLEGGAGDDYLSGGYGDNFNGGSNFDTADFNFAAAGANGVTVDFSTVLNSGGTIVVGGGTIQNIEHIEVINGSVGDDDITVGTNLILAGGSGLGNHTAIYGYLGNDKLTGGATNDDIQGGEGDDDLYGLDGNDLLSGGAGNDLLFGGDGNDSLVDVSGGNNILDGGAGDDTLRGGDSFATGGITYLRGGIGNDTLNAQGTNVVALYDDSGIAVTVDLNIFGSQSVGDRGNDIFNGVDGVAGSQFNDNLIGNSSDNRLEGRDGADTLMGNGGDDYLDGGSGDDTIFGNDGHDIIDGGSGNDMMFG